jgi:hypothetical protein
MIKDYKLTKKMHTQNSWAKLNFTIFWFKKFVKSDDFLFISTFSKEKIVFNKKNNLKRKSIKNNKEKTISSRKT